MDELYAAHADTRMKEGSVGGAFTPTHPTNVLTIVKVHGPADGGGGQMRGLDSIPVGEMKSVIEWVSYAGDVFI